MALRKHGARKGTAHCLWLRKRYIFLINLGQAHGINIIIKTVHAGADQANRGTCCHFPADYNLSLHNSRTKLVHASSIICKQDNCYFGKPNTKIVLTKLSLYPILMMNQ